LPGETRRIGNKRRKVVRLKEVRQWTRSRQFEKFPIDGILRS
jgi:hypothetical protein